MNDDHGANTVSMVKHYVGVDCSEAMIVSMDSLGMMVKAKMEVAGGGYSKIRFILRHTYLYFTAISRKSRSWPLVTSTNFTYHSTSFFRLPFPYPVTDRKQIKEVLVR